VPYLTALLAVVIRDLRISARRPDLVVQAVAVPIVVFGLASIMFGATDAWPAALTDNSRTAQSQQVTDALRDTRGAAGPYFNLGAIDPAHAGGVVEAGRAHLAVTVPSDFATERTLQVRTFNINTDTMKNVRLRLVTAANLYDRRLGLQQVTATIAKARPDDVSRTAFMGGGAILLALLLGSCLITANLFAMEQELRSTREFVLTPLGASAGALGAALAGLGLAALAAVPTALLAYGFGFRTDVPSAARAAVITLPAMIAAAGVGAIAAQRLRTHRAIQPAVIMMALATYFAAGGFIPVPGLPPAARAFAAWWPPSYIFEWTSPLLHNFSRTVTVPMLLAALGAATVGIVLAWVAGWREQTRMASNGQ
jgi:ABC-type multidrug transport system permease subunit